MRIGIDAMGGDFAPRNVVLGVIEARTFLAPDSHIVLYGDPTAIRGAFVREGCSDPLASLGCSVAPALQVIQMGEYPARAIKAKPDSSIVVGFKALRAGEIDAFAGAGNTGAMMVGSVLLLKPLAGGVRPCLPIEIPVQTGRTALFLDIGFNTDCRAETLYDFGLLGSVYARTVMGIPRPRVALLNIGQEPEKGNGVTREAYQLMWGSPDFHFVGNIEATRFFSGQEADVIVTDGFVGNVILKQAEAMYLLAQAQGLDSPFFERFNYEMHGGSLVLGLDKTVIIGHGASSPKAVASMLRKCEASYREHLVEKIAAALQKD